MSANLSFDAQHDKSGFTVTFGLDTDTLKEAVTAFEALTPVLKNKGWQPVKVSTNGQNRPQAQNDGQPPVCPTHGKPMKRSQFNGGWYCPVKVADDDGTGKPVYCKQKA